MTDGTGRLRTALADGERPALGIWIKIPATEVTELVVLAGFDFAVIDLEHSPLDLESAFRHIGTLAHTDVSTVVRVPKLDTGIARRMLDAGAEGIMVPHVDTVDDARAAVSATRFPPLGSRGIGSTSRAGQWGALPLEEYLRFGREEVVLMAQIESVTGVENAGAIAAVEGVDALFVGAVDLSVAEQRPATDPVVVDLIERVVSRARAANVPVGNAGAATADSVRAAVDAGFTFTMLGNDAGLFGDAARSAVEAARTVNRND